MDFNPYNRKHAEAEKRIADLSNQKKELDSSLDWYRSIDVFALQKTYDDGTTTDTGLINDITILEQSLADNAAELQETTSAIGSLFNPSNWFAEDQVSLRQKRKQLRERAKVISAQIRSKDQSRLQISKMNAEASSVIQKYNSFDHGGTISELSELSETLAETQDQLESILFHKQQVDEKLAPLFHELQNLQSEKQKAESKLRQAQQLDNQISNADNSYERAMVHEECERKFATGSPRSIIRDQERAIRRIGRDHAKAENRAQIVGRKAARIIETLVIDGNNLCYEGSQFVGLTVLETLLPILSKNYSVVLVFDSAIRRMTKTHDSEMRNRFEKHARVHVVASAEMADATILDLASSHHYSYVLSNDRFADFNEKEAVKKSRVIRHEIVGGRILVHDLHLNASYK